MKTLICGGRIIDPAQNMDEIGDILIEDLLICTYICANRDLNIKRRYGPAPWRLQGAV